MNVKCVLNKLFTEVKLHNPLYNSVRFRYHADKIAKGPIFKSFGYKDRLFKKGALPRIDGAPRLPMPEYRPSNNWCEKKALLGQNDYIDILGNNKIHPSRVMYEMPTWLRGVEGNEFQLLIRKRKMLSPGILPIAQPTKWKHINKRITHLYKFLNQKTKTGLIKRE